MLVVLSAGQTGGFLYAPDTLAEMYRRLDWYSWGESKELRKRRLVKGLEEADRQALNRLLLRLLDVGVVELGYRNDQEPLPATVRLTEAGAAVLAQAPLPELSAGTGQVVLQPDFQLFALGPVPLPRLLQIERLTVREKVQPASIGYRLTRDSVYQALLHGTTVQEILAFLQDVTEQPVPQNVARTLYEWGAQHERITVHRQIMVIDVESPELMQRLLADSVLGALLQPVDERTAYAPVAEKRRISRRLWDLELLPAVSSGPGEDLPHSLRWEEDALVPRVPLPSLYVVGTLRRFAQRQDDGKWALTAESVREGARAGLDADEMAALLEQMTGEPVPVEWEKRLKAWARHYGEALTAEVRLLRFESQEVLTELRESDTKLHRWLRPLLKEGALAIVSERRWEEAVDLLAEWGVAIREERWW